MGRGSKLERRDNELEYRDLKMRGENNRVQNFEMVVVYTEIRRQFESRGMQGETQDVFLMRLSTKKMN